MNDLITVQGVVLSAMPVGEYDKRIVLLTRERGKISAFAKGARRPSSPFLAAANPFVFGSFTVYEGRTSYNLHQAVILHHFVELASRQPGIYYGYYFLDVADYFGHEGTDEKEMINLLYLCVRALLNPSIDDRLVRCVFELRAMTEQGMMPRLFSCAACGREPSEGEAVFFSQSLHGILCAGCAAVRRISDFQPLVPAALAAMQYISCAPMPKLFAFTVSGKILQELEGQIHPYLALNTDRKFKSLAVLEQMAAEK